MLETCTCTASNALEVIVDDAEKYLTGGNCITVLSTRVTTTEAKKVLGSCVVGYYQLLKHLSAIE